MAEDFSDLSGVLGFRGGQTHKLRAGKGEGRCNKDAAKPLEAVVEGSRVAPVLPSNITFIRPTPTVQYYAKDTDDVLVKYRGI